MPITDDVLSRLQALATSPARRISPKAAATYLGFSIRTLEEWRRSWSRAAEAGDPKLRRGPPFFKIGKKRVLYEVADLEKFIAADRTTATGADD